MDPPGNVAPQTETLAPQGSQGGSTTRSMAPESNHGTTFDAWVVLPATWSASLRPVVLPKGGHAGSRVLWTLRWLSAISSLNSALHLVHLDCDLVRRRAHYLKLVPAFAQSSKVVKEMGPPTPRSASF